MKVFIIRKEILWLRLRVVGRHIPQNCLKVKIVLRIAISLRQSLAVIR